MSDHEFKKVSIIGLGYIGLPTAAMFASRGVEVVGIDVSAHAVETINRGDIHIVEPDLDMIVRSAVTTGKLRASLTPEPADAFLIAVPTPFDSQRNPDLSYIRSAAESIAPVLAAGNLVILESTSPVGATEKLCEWLAQARPDLSFPNTADDAATVQIAHCPERVLPGQVMQELVANDRIVGGLSSRCANRAKALYGVFVKGECHLTDARTAELAKLTENSFRDVNIAFANELSLICDELEINVWDLVKLANKHPRVNILSPGPGVGGHCIAVDPWFIVSSAPEQARLIRKSREINDAKPAYVVDRVKQEAKAFKAPVIACLGLTFKADIDDLRESPAKDITQMLAESGVGRILVVEPNITRLPEGLLGLSNVEHVELDVALRDSTIVAALVDHASFKAIDRSRLDSKVLIDTRGIWG